jgi:hypothetical protein
MATLEDKNRSCYSAELILKDCENVGSVFARRLKVVSGSSSATPVLVEGR